jgi:hypothetical protein
MATYHPNSAIGKFLAIENGTTCPACNCPKARGRALCSHDFFRLPEEIRNRLYSRDEERRLEAFEDAKAALEA